MEQTLQYSTAKRFATLGKVCLGSTAFRPMLHLAKAFYINQEVSGQTP